MSLKQLESEVLLELALSIGDSLELEPMLQRFMARTTRLLDRSVVLLVEGDPANSASRRLRSMPRNFATSPLAIVVLEQVGWPSLMPGQAWRECALQLMGRDMVVHIFPVPGHGWLLALGSPTQWSRNLLEGLVLLGKKLAGAITACEIQNQLIERSRQLELATRAGSVGLWEWNIDADQLRWNEQMFELYGVEPAEFSGSPEEFFRHIHPEDIDDVRLRIRNFMQHGGDDTSELHFRIRSGDGKLKKLVGFGSHHLAADGTRCMVGVNYDVSTLERSATQTLYRSELEKLMLELSMKVILAPAGRLDDITNDALRDVGHFVGADRAYRFDYDWDTNLSYNTHEWCAEGIAPQIDNLQGIPVDDIPSWVNAHREGLPFYISRVNDLPPGHGVRVILEPQDIRSIVTIPLLDDGHCLGFIGFDAVREERHWTDVDLALLKVLAQLLVNAQVKSRNEINLQTTARDLRRSRDAARRLALAAEQANQAKSRFVATVSHEIRTPLHAILGLADVLAEQSLPSAAKQLVSSLHDAGTVLLELINDVLDFSRIESEEVELQSVVFDLRDLVEGLRQLFDNLAEKSGLALDVQVTPGLPHQFVGDPLRLRQVLNNLLSNAIKFTDHGTVSLQVSALGSQSAGSGESMMLAFQVMDTGIGISALDQQRIFEAFYQADATDSRSYTGTGLGLTIANMLVKRMGGELQVRSTVGEGAVFTVNLPLTVAPVEAPRQAAVSGSMPAPEQLLAGLRVLLAEDNPVNRQLVSLYLRAMDCELVMVENGEQAVTHFAQLGADVVLMDCQMPVMDGFSATRAIRELNKAGASVPIIAVTASGTGEDVSRCLQLGMNDVLIKPFTRQQLLQALLQWRPGRLSEAEEQTH